MSYNQELVLRTIADCPGTTLKDIAKSLDIHEKSINRALNSLIKFKQIRYEATDCHGTRKYWAIP